MREEADELERSIGLAHELANTIKRQLDVVAARRGRGQNTTQAERLLRELMGSFEWQRSRLLKALEERGRDPSSILSGLLHFPKDDSEF